MIAAPAGVESRLAPALNASCQCIWLDRERLRRQLAQNLGDAGLLLESKPGLVSGSVVFVDAQDAESMDRTTRLVQRALSSPTYRHLVADCAPPIARRQHGTTGGLLGLDFHLGTSTPQLIEINTNPGGLLVNLELARAVSASCDCMTAPLAGLASGGMALDDLPRLVARHFHAQWTAARGDETLRSIAIVDDDPQNQYLYTEFLLYQQLFAKAGWTARICDADRIENRGGALVVDGQRTDLVYNRLTDFYFEEKRHEALRYAFEDGLAVITPDPAQHAHWADKRLLAWLRDDALLSAAELDTNERRDLQSAIPATELVAREAGEDLWRRRRNLYFKPAHGHGSKAVYRGDRITRSAFEHVLSRHYVAQEAAPASLRSVLNDGASAELRLDVRNYTLDGLTLLRAARLYRGQTTNFRTPGGGFAPVLTLPR